MTDHRESRRGEPAPQAAHQVTADEVEAMSVEERARLAARLDDVDVVRNTPAFPLPGTRAEKRAARSVAAWLAVSAVSGVAFVLAFLLWPYEYRTPLEEGHLLFALYTPVVGATFGIAVLALSFAVIVHVRRFFPDEVSVQQRHDGPSSDVARRTVVAQMVVAGRDTGIGRRSLIKRSGGVAAGVLGVGLGVAAVAPLVRDPWEGEGRAPLWVTPWASREGETVYLRYDTGDPTEVVLARPELQGVNSMMTVFPFRESERGDEEALLHALTEADAPVMLIRLSANRPIVHREGQEGFHYGQYFAYSKICTHLGCPASLFEAQTALLLCPCHQSQFLATEYARPVFGPAARPLPQLPVTVNEEGYFVATSDFVEPVGPAFWEMGRV